MTAAGRRLLLLPLAACGLLGAAVEAPAAPQPARAAAKAPAQPRAAKAAPRAVKAPAQPRAAKGPAPRAGVAKRDPMKRGAFARVAFGQSGELRPTREPAGAGRRSVALTPEEETAAQIQKLLRGPLRAGVTGLFVADARSGEPLFAVNAADPLNPASNVKMISTAAALELLGPEFRYPTRLLGATPVGGVVQSDVYLLGSYDPTLTVGDLGELAGALAARGVTAIKGDLVVGSDPTRDGLYRAILPIAITAGEPGKPPTATPPAGVDLVEVKVTATTAARPGRARLTYKDELTTNERGQPRIVLTIGGTIGKGASLSYPLWTRQRTAAAAYSLIAALRARGIAVSGEMKRMELGDFIGETVEHGALPVELGRHESQRVADIAATVNKWSINWLADRLIMTAAGLAARKPPSMELGLEAMYAWLARHPHLDKQNLVIDTGSGLSYNTQISSQELVSIVRSAAGFASSDATSRPLADAWLRSLSVAGSDGTLARRFRGTSAAGHILGKTGTLARAIALAGVLDVDPQRPLAFALVTNTDAPLSKPYVRRAHELVIAELCKYLARTSRAAVAAPAAAAAAAVSAAAVLPAKLAAPVAPAAAPAAPAAAPAVPAAPAAPAVPAKAAADAPATADEPRPGDEVVGEDYDAQLDAETLEQR